MKLVRGQEAPSVRPEISNSPGSSLKPPDLVYGSLQRLLVGPLSLEPQTLSPSLYLTQHQSHLPEESLCSSAFLLKTFHGSPCLQNSVQSASVSVPSHLKRPLPLQGGPASTWGRVTHLEE